MVAYHSRKKKTAILLKVLVCFVDCKVFKRKALPRDALLEIRNMPEKGKRKRKELLMSTEIRTEE